MRSRSLCLEIYSQINMEGPPRDEVLYWLVVSDVIYFCVQPLLEMIDPTHTYILQVI